jgi:hypothetical protein
VSKWIDTVPEKPGYYWHRTKPADNSPLILQVDQHRRILRHGALFPLQVGQWDHWRGCIFGGQFWDAPIMPPWSPELHAVLVLTDAQERSLPRIDELPGSDLSIKIHSSVGLPPDAQCLAALLTTSVGPWDRPGARQSRSCGVFHGGLMSRLIGLFCTSVGVLAPRTRNQ